MKTCRTCGETKDPSQFYRAKSNRDGRQTRCAACCAEVQALWHASNPDYSKRRYAANRERLIADSRKHTLRKLYGITVEQYDEMRDRQDGLCALCSDPPLAGKRLAVDHDHITGRVRALLCAHCNTALGLFKEDPARLQSALQYLETHQ